MVGAYFSDKADVPSMFSAIVPRRLYIVLKLPCAKGAVPSFKVNDVNSSVLFTVSGIGMFPGNA